MLRRSGLFVLVMVIAALLPAQTSAQAPLCFNVPGITNCIAGRFLEYWQQSGGLRAFGYPVSAVAVETSDDGQMYPTQWFERNRFELHVNNARPYDVLLGRLGAARLQQIGRNWQAEPREPGPKAGCLWFAETGHNICDQQPGYDAPGSGFLVQWEGIFDGPPCNLESVEACHSVDLAFYGLPLTSVRVETNSSGDTVETQWFERARFEWHTDGSGSGRVLLGLLGNEVRGNTPIPSPPGVGRLHDRVVRNVTALTVTAMATGHRGRNRSGSFYDPRPGFYLVIVEVIEENVGLETHDYNRFNYELKDTDGYVYEQPSGFSPDYLMSSGQLSPGEKVRAIIPFEVRNGVVDLTLNYTFFEATDSRIQIALK